MGRWWSRAVMLGVGAWMAMPSPAHAQSATTPVAEGGAEAPAPVVRVLHTTGSFDIDGRLSEPFWDEAAPIELAWEIDPGYNTPAPVRTTCRLARADDALLLGCTASDPDARQIRAYVTDRDALEGQDRIILTLDPFADARRGFRFTISALGVQADALVAAALVSDEEGAAAEEDPSWDAIWASDGRITDAGYTVEAAIPFKSLRFPEGGGEGFWRVQIERVWPRDDRVRMRSTAVDRSDGCSLCQSDPLTGLDGIEPGTNIQLTPTLTVTRSDHAPPGSAGSLDDGPVEGEFGLTGSWGITSGMTLGVTANPDFSQVEADVAQLEVNNQFALFFPERRPFFLEGSDVFATPSRAFFSRTISDPTAGLKLTGKSGPWAVGLVAAHDEEPPLLIPGSQASATTAVGEPVTTVVGRARHDVGRSSTVGFLLTGREGRSYHNRLGGVDALVRPFSSLTVRAEALFTSTDYPDSLAARHDEPSESFSGASGRMEWEWTSRDWQVDGNLTARSEGFRADAGFVPRVGTVGGNTSVRRIFRGGRDRWFSRIFLEAGYWRQQEMGGPILDGNGFWFGLSYRGPLQSQITFFPNVGWDTHFQGVSWTSLDNMFVNGSIRPWADLEFRLDANVGDAIDFTNVRLAKELFLNPSLELRAGRHVTLSLGHRFRRLDDLEGREIFTAQVSELRGWYNFSPRSFLRLVLQGRWTDRNPERYSVEVEAEERSLLVQALYSYKLNPQTAVFLGYGDDREGAHRLLPRSRTFFLKLGYAWRP